MYGYVEKYVIWPIWLTISPPKYVVSNLSLVFRLRLSNKTGMVDQTVFRGIVFRLQSSEKEEFVIILSVLVG